MHGLYIGNESRPVETGELEELRRLVKHLTPEQRRDGWIIAPVNLWIELPQKHSHNPFWVALGVVLLLATAYFLIAFSL